jgi:hypothetical protein
MGLKEVFQGVGQTIFAAFGNIKKTELTYVVKNDSYVPGSGVTESDTEYTIDGYLIEYESEEIDGASVLSTDRRFLMLVQDYPLIIPKMGDELVDDDSQRWRVEKKYKDPADTIWDLQLRLPT